MTTTMTPASAPTTPDAVHAPLEGSPGIPFRRLLEVERRKIVDTRSGAWLLGITALLTALTLAVMLIWGESDGLGFMGLLSVATMPLSLLLPILGILTATTEWSQRTALVTFTLEPRRGRVVVAKLLAVVLLSLTVLVLTIVASALFYVASTTLRDGPADWSYEPAVVAKLLLLLTIYLVQGLAFGLLFLNTPAAIVTSLLLPMVFTVVTYIFKQDRGGPMGSPYRRQALAAIEAKCKAGSRLVREGEVRGYTSAGMGTIEGTEDEERGRRWGIRFECKGSEREHEAADQSQSEPRRNP